MQIIEDAAVDAAIQRLLQRDHQALHSWVWANPSQAIVVDWDGDNEIEIAERAISLGVAAQAAGNTAVIRADIEGSSFFFSDAATKLVPLIDSL